MHLSMGAAKAAVGTSDIDVDDEGHGELPTAPSMSLPDVDIVGLDAMTDSSEVEDISKVHKQEGLPHRHRSWPFGSNIPITGVAYEWQNSRRSGSRAA